MLWVHPTISSWTGTLLYLTVVFVHWDRREARCGGTWWNVLLIIHGALFLALFAAVAHGALREIYHQRLFSTNFDAAEVNWLYNTQQMQFMYLLPSGS